MRPTMNLQAARLDRRITMAGALIIVGAVAWALAKPSEPAKPFQSKAPITDTNRP